MKIFQFAAALPLPASLISALMSPAVAPLLLFIVFVPWALVVLKALVAGLKEEKSSSNIPRDALPSCSVFQVLHITPGLSASPPRSCLCSSTLSLPEAYLGYLELGLTKAVSHETKQIR